MTESLKIFHIIAGLGNGGAESVLYRLCINDTNNHTVISLMDAGKYGPLLRTEGVEVYCLNMPKGRISLRGLKTLWKILRTGQPDVVQTWMYHADLVGGFFARLAGIGYICWGIHHSNLEPGKNKYLTIWLARLCAVLSPYVPQHIVCCAQQAAEVHQALGYSKGKLVVIPNGYDLNWFRPDIEARARLRNEWGFSNEIPLLGMIGRFDPQKDHKNLIDALCQLRKKEVPFRCVLVGNGLSRDNKQLVSWLEEAQLFDQILLLGIRNDIPSVMNALDIHVLPSIGEAFPNVLAEAMSCGTPCVTTDVGDAALIVGETGWIVPPKNSNMLAYALDDAIVAWHDHILWPKRQRACRVRIEQNYEIEKMVCSYNDVWKRVSKVL